MNVQYSKELTDWKREKKNEMIPIPRSVKACKVLYSTSTTLLYMRLLLQGWTGKLFLKLKDSKALLRLMNIVKWASVILYQNKRPVWQITQILGQQNWSISFCISSLHVAPNLARYSIVFLVISSHTYISCHKYMALNRSRLIQWQNYQIALTKYDLYHFRQLSSVKSLSCFP